VNPIASEPLTSPDRVFPFINGTLAAMCKSVGWSAGDDGESVVTLSYGVGPSETAFVNTYVGDILDLQLQSGMYGTRFQARCRFDSCYVVSCSPNTMYEYQLTVLDWAVS
jgi:hypothetical protein